LPTIEFSGHALGGGPSCFDLAVYGFPLIGPNGRVFDVLRILLDIFETMLDEAKLAVPPDASATKTSHDHDEHG
jgi:hypothetical protein